VLLATPNIDSGGGGIILGSLIDRSSQMEITGAVTDSNFTIAVRGAPQYPAYAGLVLDHPAQFAGNVTLGFGYVELSGLKADSLSYDGTTLRLYAGNTIVDTIAITTEAVDNLPSSLVIEQSNHGAMLSTDGTTGAGLAFHSDLFQPGGPGLGPVIN
jgi:hypothetical protein